MLNEKRKEYYQTFNECCGELLQSKIGHISNPELTALARKLVETQKNLVTAEDKVKRFRNQQNNLFIRLLESEEMRTNKKNSIISSNLEDIGNFFEEEK